MVSIPSLIPKGKLKDTCNNVAGEQYLGLAEIMGHACEALSPAHVELKLDNTPTMDIA